MTFKKLALASAIALVPTAGFSVDLLGDESLSSVTGQDGLEVSVTTPVAGITGDIYVHDTDGLTGLTGLSAYSFDGAIVIDNFGFVGNLTLEIHAGDNAVATSAPTLDIYVNIPSASLATGDIRVANSQRDEGNAWGVNTTSGVLLSNMNIELSTVTMNIQLGNEPQGNMIAMNTSIASGLTISNFALNDAGGAITGGALGALTTQIVGNGGGALGVNVGINSNTSGLVITVGTLGNASGIDMRITDAYLGTTTAGIVGDITLVGLNLNGSVITVSGK